MNKPWGVFGEILNFGSSANVIRTGGYLKKDGFPQVFTEAEAKQVAAKRNRHKEPGQRFTARPLEAHVVEFLRSQGVRV
jgi:hypothetical protein